MSNLAIAYESKSSTYGSRVQVQPGIQFRPDQFLGELCLNSGGPAPVCTALQTLLESLLPETTTSAADAKAPEPTRAPVRADPA